MKGSKINNVTKHIMLAYWGHLFNTKVPDNHVWLPKMEELHRMSHNEFKKHMVLSYNSIQCGRTAEYLLGPNSASSVVMLSRCYYMDLRHGKK